MIKFRLLSQTIREWWFLDLQDFLVTYRGHIVFNTLIGDDLELFIVNVDRKELSQITDNQDSDIFLYWASDQFSSASIKCSFSSGLPTETRMQCSSEPPSGLTRTPFFMSFLNTLSTSF